jgi:hypothetical protein
MGDQLVARSLPTHRRTQTQNKSIQTFMPRVGFETTIPVFELPKTVHALDRAATGVAIFLIKGSQFIMLCNSQLIREFQCSEC